MVLTEFSAKLSSLEDNLHAITYTFFKSVAGENFKMKYWKALALQYHVHFKKKQKECEWEITSIEKNKGQPVWLMSWKMKVKKHSRNNKKRLDIDEVHFTWGQFIVVSFKFSRDLHARIYHLRVFLKNTIYYLDLTS